MALSDRLDRTPLITGAGIGGQVSESTGERIENKRRGGAADVDRKIDQTGFGVGIAVTAEVGQ
jgi:hypothetical protein